MGGQRQSSKGYVDGFLQFFDWNAKSRKKLFSHKSDNPEQSKQKKSSDGNLPITRFNLVKVDVDEYVAVPRFNGNSDYSCTSSVTDEVVYGSKAPSVVARLMGLDTMPTIHPTEAFSTPFSDSQSLQGFKYVHEKLDFREVNHIMKAQKSMNRPIEKFRSDNLPPKSAKTIPIDRLLSPIKGSGFISSSNAIHIMEAAAKIIEPKPQAFARRTKMPSLRKSSVPFKVKDLREKVEASKTPVQSNAANILKGQPINKSWNGSPNSEDKKGKSISLALQAKVNVQKREGKKEPRSVILSQPLKSQSSSRKSNISGALKQNNQKQNCTIDKEKLNTKPSVPNSQCRQKISSGDSSSGRCKNSSKYDGNLKVGSRKLSPETKCSKEEVLYSSSKNLPRKRRSLDGNFSKHKAQVVDNMLVDDDEKAVQFNVVVDKQFEGTDVVSFTFTAPLSRQNNVFGSDHKSQKTMLSSDSRNIGKPSLVKCNVIGADNISDLVEKKLRDLTHGAESSRYRDSDNFAPNFQDNASITVPHKKYNQDAFYMDVSSGKDEGSNLTLTERKRPTTKYKLQGTTEEEECKIDDTETRKSFYYRHLSPISVLDSSFMTESWNSSDVVHNINMEGSKQGSSSVQALEVHGVNAYTTPLMDLDAELTDSASSSSIISKMKMKNMATSNRGSKWELQYVREILFNVELFINLHIFEELESRKVALKENPNEKKLERKVLFDCVREFMDLRCSRYINVGFRTWEKGMSIVKRKERLAEDVYKEILDLKGIEDTNVDDFLDKDMSSRYGKWLDFEIDAFELGVEIEGCILDSLINEVAADLLV